MYIGGTLVEWCSFPPYYIGQSHKPIQIQGGKTPLFDERTVKMCSYALKQPHAHTHIYMYVHRIQTEGKHTKI